LKNSEVELLKPLVLSLQSKTNNNDEFLTSLSELILVMTKEKNTLYEHAIRILFEEKFYNFAFSSRIFQLVALRLKELYLIEFDLEKLRKEAENSLENEWPELKKQISDYLDIAGKIEDVFKQNDNK
jgi:hypothetical protein